MNKIFYIIATGNDFLATFRVSAENPFDAFRLMFSRMPVEKQEQVRNVAIHCVKENESLLKKIARPFHCE